MQELRHPRCKLRRPVQVLHVSGVPSPFRHFRNSEVHVTGCFARRKMGCAVSVSNIDVFGRTKKVGRCVPDIVVYAPRMRLPLQCDFQRMLEGLAPNDLVDRFSSLRRGITSLAKSECESAGTDLLRHLQDYLSVLIGLTRKEHGHGDLVEFKWKEDEAGPEEIYAGNSWLELLSVVYLMSTVTLSEVNSSLMRMLKSDSSDRIVPEDYTRNAVEMLLKASGFLEFCINIHHLSPEMESRVPRDMQGAVLRALSIQALGQGTELQLGLAVESSNATLSVKRRLACELLTYFTQAYQCLSECEISIDYMKKHMLFIKWKCLEAKASAYYYHGCMLDKGQESSCQLSAACCFFAAREFLDDSKKSFINFCLAFPVNKSPPWGAIKHLEKRIRNAATRKLEVYGYQFQKDQKLPELPNFKLSLKPDEYELPKVDPGWNNVPTS